MSGFFGSKEATTKWSGYFKQAISNVENTFDSFLIDQPTSSSVDDNGDSETETFVDPISGAITTITRSKKTPAASVANKSSTISPSSSATPSPRHSSDLSSRLAAVMADKKVTKRSSFGSNKGSNGQEETSKIVSSENEPSDKSVEERKQNAVQDDSKENKNMNESAVEITAADNQHEGAKSYVDVKEDLSLPSTDIKEIKNHDAEAEGPVDSEQNVKTTAVNELEAVEKPEKNDNDEISTRESDTLVEDKKSANQSNEKKQITNNNDRQEQHNNQKGKSERDIQLTPSQSTESQKSQRSNKTRKKRGKRKGQQQQQQYQQQQARKENDNTEKSLAEGEEKVVEPKKNNDNNDELIKQIDDEIRTNGNFEKGTKNKPSVTITLTDSDDKHGKDDKEKGIVQPISQPEKLNEKDKPSAAKTGEQNQSLDEIDENDKHHDSNKSNEMMNTAATLLSIDNQSGDSTSIPTMKDLQLEDQLATTKDKDQILEQREKQLLQAMENIATLHDQLQQMQENLEKKGLNISNLETKLKQSEDALIAQQQTGNVSSNMQKNLKKLEGTIEDLQKQITVKDEKIQGLLSEGEKLSKTELKHSTTIKKLRQEKLESDKQIQELTKKVDKLQTSLNEIIEKSTKQNETEKKLQESVKLLNNMTEQQTKHINKLESEKSLIQKKLNETEILLENSRESMEQEKARIKSEAEKASQILVDKQSNMNDLLRKELDTLEQSSRSMEKRLRREIKELQIKLQNTEEEAGAREDDLRKQLVEYQTKLQQSDIRMEDLNISVEEATAPLLRQIEELQFQHAAAIKHRDETEQSLIVRMQLAEAEHEKILQEENKLKDEIHDLRQLLEASECKLKELQSTADGLKRQAEEDEKIKKDLKEKIELLMKEKQEQNERELKNQEGLKIQYQRLIKERLSEERKQFELKLQKAVASTAASGTLSIATSPIKAATVSDEEPVEVTSPTSSVYSNSNMSNIQINRPFPIRIPSIDSRSSFDSNAAPSASSISGGAGLVEKLQANLRRLENQVNFYQTQLQNASQSRGELSEEVLHLTQEIDQLRKDAKKSEDLEHEYKDLHARYQTSLELLGERTEEVQELKADLQDVKEMYKSQIVELVQKIDQLSSPSKK